MVRLTLKKERPYQVYHHPVEANPTTGKAAVRLQALYPSLGGNTPGLFLLAPGKQETKDDKRTQTYQSQIFKAYNKARAFARKYPHLLNPKRVNRALGILQTAGDYFVGKDFSSSQDHCGCADSTYRRMLCKHSIAFMMLEKIQASRQAIT